MSAGGAGWLAALGIALGGGVGAAARYAVDQAVPVPLRERFPWGILVVNLTGSLLMGVLVGLALGEPWLAVLATGVLGGYTTFSTASLDTARMVLERRPIGSLLNGIGVLAAGVGLALIGILLGDALSRL